MTQPSTTSRSLDSLSLLDFSAASTNSTTSSSTIAPGIGALSGKFILGFGKMVLRGAEVVVILRRLSYIQSSCPLSDDKPPPDIEKVYDDLLELSRPGLYPNVIRRKPLRLICEQIKISETRYLLSSLEKWPPDEKMLILCEILTQFDTIADTANMSDFGTIISLCEEVLDHLSTQNPVRPNLLSKLASVLWRRFDKTLQLADLERAIPLAREALVLLPPPNEHRQLALHNLAALFWERFKKTGQIADLEEGVSFCRQAVQLLTLGSNSPFLSLSNLALILSERFHEMGDLADLEMAIHLRREILKLRGLLNAERSKSLRGLADHCPVTHLSYTLHPILRSYSTP